MPEPTLPRNFPPHPGIFLVGFMGSGKTTVGEILSQNLGWQFQDLDSRIEARQGCRIEQIFSNHGEQRFRQFEREALLELMSEMRSQPTVAALGGGAFVQPENRVSVQDSGLPVIFLDAPIEDLWERCRSQGNERPLARDQNLFRQLYEARRDLYMEAGTPVDTSDKDPVTVAAEIASWLRRLSSEER